MRARARVRVRIRGRVRAGARPAARPLRGYRGDAGEMQGRCRGDIGET